MRGAAVVFVVLVLAACDDAGVGARRALLERFSGPAGRSAPVAGRAVDAAGLAAGRGWADAFTQHAERGGGAAFVAEVAYDAVGPDGRAARLEVKARVAQRADGAFHARLDTHHETSDGARGESGREAYWLARLLYTRLGRGPFHVRRSLHREQERWGAAPLDAVAGLFGALGSALTVTPTGGGRYRIAAAPDAPAIGLDAAAEAALRDSDATWGDWFRGEFALVRADGELVLDPAGGVVREVRLDVSAQSRAPGAPVRLHVKATGRLAPLPADAASWEPPAGARPPGRERTHARIERILAPFRPTPDTTP